MLARALVPAHNTLNVRRVLASVRRARVGRGRGRRGRGDGRLLLRGRRVRRRPDRLRARRARAVQVVPVPAPGVAARLADGSHGCRHQGHDAGVRRVVGRERCTRQRCNV